MTANGNLCTKCRVVCPLEGDLCYVCRPRAKRYVGADRPTCAGCQRTRPNMGKSLCQKCRRSAAYREKKTPPPADPLKIARSTWKL